MASTYTPIATQTLGSAAATVTFSSIPSTYTDLVLVASNKITTGGAAGLHLTFNTDAGATTNYSNTYVYGDGASAASGRASNGASVYVGNSDANNFNTLIVNIQNYSNTSIYKSLISRAAIPAYYVISYVGLWRKTEAINLITVRNDVGNFATGSTFTLYGIKAA